MQKNLPYFLAFLSGTCALVYEIVWMRAFTPVFGLSIYATTAVLCAFMGGLGLGSRLAPLVLRRWRGKRWTLYAVIELGIGVTTLTVPFLIGPITSAYVAVAGIDSAGLVTGAVRFFLSISVLITPTFLMGLTLPAILHALRREQDADSADTIGRIYGLNTVGGAVGCLLVGFVLLYQLGIVRSIVLMAGVNFMVAALAYYLGRAERHDAAAPALSDEVRASTAAVGQRRVSRMGLLLVYGLIGAISFGYELVWFRVLIFYLQSATYSFSTMLTLYLLGIGLGSLVFSRVMDRRLRTPREVAMALGLVQLLIGVNGVCMLHVYSNVEWTWSLLITVLGANSWLVIVAQKAIVAGLIILPPTFLMGLTFPLFSRLYKAHGTSDSLALGRLYAANTFGAIAGTLLTGFVLFDLIGVQATISLLSVASAAIGIGFSLSPLRRYRERAAPVFAVAVGVLVLGFTAVTLATPARMLVANYERVHGEIFFYRESAADITFVYSLGSYFALGFGDGRGTSSTSPMTNYVNRLLAYSAMVARPDAKDVLVISMGCGNTASAFTAFPIDRLDIVDISSGPFEAARFFDTNRDVLADPRVHTIVEDGRNYLLKNTRRYDIIEIELPTLHTDGVAFLYTKEFYELARSRLKEGGVISQWIDVRQTRREASYMAFNTMLEEFPNSSVWANKWAWWAIGVNGENQPLDYPRLRSLFAQPKVLEDTAIVHSSLEDVLASVVAFGDELVGAVGDSPRISDDRTVLDFEVPKIEAKSALGGGLGYYNSPMRSVFMDAWKRSGVLNEDRGAQTFFENRHHERVDRSLREFARGFPEEVLRRISASNGNR